MDDPFVMRRFKGLGDLPGDVQRLRQRQRTLGILAFHQLHHNGVLLKPKDRGDVGMVQRRQCLRLALEASEVVGVVGERGGQHLDGHVAIQLRVPRSIDLAHPAGTQGAEDFVGSEMVADGEGHDQSRLPDPAIAWC